MEQRRERLLELVRGRGFASLPELCQVLEVSESTVRRDLDHLERAGQARRTHGGVFYVGSAPRLPPFSERQPAQWEKKCRIAEATLDLIDDGDTILIDGGTTTYELAQRLVGRRLQIVTNSLPIANLFASDPTSDLVVLGGYVYPRTGVTLGPAAEQMLADLRVRKTVLSAAGITEGGLYNSNLLLVQTEQAMIRAADETLVLVDSTKFGRQDLAYLCGLGDVSRLVVDDRLSEDWRSRIHAAGVALTLAPTDVGPGPEAES